MESLKTFLVISEAGSRRDLSRPTREQDFWDEHGEFIDRLVDEGFMFMGGPLPDEGGAVIMVRAANELEVRKKLELDPWYVHHILTLVSVKRWDIFVDRRS